MGWGVGVRFCDASGGLFLQDASRGGGGMGLGGEGDAALGDGDEGSEGIMQWFLLILV